MSLSISLYVYSLLYMFSFSIFCIFPLTYKSAGLIRYLILLSSQVTLISQLYWYNVTKRKLLCCVDDCWIELYPALQKSMLSLCLSAPALSMYHVSLRYWDTGIDLGGGCWDEMMCVTCPSKQSWKHLWCYLWFMACGLGVWRSCRCRC